MSPAPPARLLVLVGAAVVARSLELRGLQSLVAHRGDQDQELYRTVGVSSSFGGVRLKFPAERYDRCFGLWQQQCWQNWQGDDIAIARVCNESLQRPHLQSHLVLPAELVRKRMRLSMPRHWAANAAPRLFVPRFTALGWKMVSPPVDMHQQVVEWYESQRYRMVAEDWPAMDDVGCNNNYDNDDYLIPHDSAPPVMAMGEWIKEQLQEWMGTEVDPDWHIFYGARLQRRGGTCGLHVDSGETHIMSATYNIAQRRQSKPWPLAFVEPGGHVSKANQQPGNVVFYEGGSGMHGRPEPLDGEEFVSIYFHFRPKNWLSMYHKAMPSDSAFSQLVQLREPSAPFVMPENEINALQDDSCPAQAEDTHSAAGLQELWRAAITLPRHTFSPGSLSQANVHDLVVEAPAPEVGAPREAKGRPVLLLQEEPESRGLGADRATWEAAALVAQLHGRALVLPPGSRLEKELDIDRLRAALPVLTAEEYERSAGVNYAKVLATAPGANSLCAAADPFYRLAGLTQDAASEAAVVFSRKTGPCSGSSDIWRLAAPGPAGEPGRKLLQRGFAWSREARGAAAQAVHNLGLWDFVALHARDLGDWRRVDADVTLARWVGYLQPGTTLYVAGDGARAFAGKGGPLNVTILTWQNLQLEEGASKEPVEELICAHARLFAGAGASQGFTGRVRRARQELRAPTTAPVHYQETESQPRDSLMPNRVAAELQIWRQGVNRGLEMNAANLLQTRREQLHEQGTAEVSEDFLRDSLA